ncbi:MAG: aldo/keto reductase [Candidatus Nanoarchaeia archaeon]
MLRYNRLKGSELYVSNLALGLWGISSWDPKCGQLSQKELVDYALKNGINFFDTAFVYGNGNSECQLNDVSNKAVISTKVPSQSKDYLNKQPKDCYPLDFMQDCIDVSIQRLNSNCIDILHLHNWNPQWTNSESRYIFEYIEELKNTQTIKSFGISLPKLNTYSIEDFSMLARENMVDCLQVHYNLIDQESEKLIQYFINNKKSVFIKSPYKHGLIGKSLSELDSLEEYDFRKKRFTKQEFNDIKEELLEKSKRYNVRIKDLDKVTLRDCNATGATCIIVGMRDLETITRNLESITE